MNCFQFSIFAVLDTTDHRCRNIEIGCELLSIQYLCSIRYNSGSQGKVFSAVVNCFQFSIFAVLDTTAPQAPKVSKGCELLSIQYLCSIRYNTRR